MIGELLYNASWPLTIFGAALAAMGVADYFVHKEEDNLVRGMMWFMVGAIIAIIGWSAPDPSANKIIVYRNRVIYKEPARVELFDRCLSNLRQGRGALYEGDVSVCRDTAVLQTGGVRTIRTTVPRIVYKISPFQEIFKGCLSSSTASNDERLINACRQVAAEGTRGIVYANERKAAETFK